jgi:hypothetical protein
MKIRKTRSVSFNTSSGSVALGSVGGEGHTQAACQWRPLAEVRLPAHLAQPYVNCIKGIRFCALRVTELAIPVQTTGPYAPATYHHNLTHMTPHLNRDSHRKIPVLPRFESESGGESTAPPSPCSAVRVKRSRCHFHAGKCGRALKLKANSTLSLFIWSGCPCL